MTPGTVDRNGDLRYLASGNWNLWPYCPMKRYNPKERRNDIAYLIEGEGPVLHLGNMYAAKTTDPTERFESFAAMLDAGWVVD